MENLLERAIRDLSTDTSTFKILVYLSFKGSCLPGQISDETGIPSGTVRPALRTLLGKGYVSQNDDGTYKAMVAFTDVISDLYTRLTRK